MNRQTSEQLEVVLAQLEAHLAVSSSVAFGTSSEVCCIGNGVDLSSSMSTVKATKGYAC